ncbi:response regulator [Rhodospirillum centenum]|uniref:Response regulator receiver domain protein n=1 Tax=Rhodospirillum centenum (strain ATCC 51521 / SW) TaxID=414684 RepID=B6ITZ7_RHOCS|nr:response regulator [Rhodospirillum centenum]ACI99533.1 response regulator receiver domain protein [Rhodospirillum centenum SW]
MTPVSRSKHPGGPEPAAAAKPVALVIEDDGVISLELRLMLARRGWRSMAATNWEEAFLCWRRERCDLLVVDGCLRDGEDGIALARALTGDRPTPLVFVTAGPERVDDAGLAGVPVVAKPFIAREFLAAVERALAGRKAAARVA